MSISHQWDVEIVSTFCRLIILYLGAPCREIGEKLLRYNNGAQRLPLRGKKIIILKKNLVANGGLPEVNNALQADPNLMCVQSRSLDSGTPVKKSRHKYRMCNIVLTHIW